MGKSSTSSLSSISSSSNHPVFSTASSLKQDLPTDLRLGLSISATQHAGEVNDCSDHTSFYVKVYMEGIPIGRKLDLLAHDGYHELVKTLEHMFDTTILLGTEMDRVLQPAGCHVLTYEDEEGDLIVVGDVPWEVFLSTVKRLKITRVDAFGC